MSQRPDQLPKRSAIFINYRREDSAGHAGRLFDRLSTHFPGRVFMDIDTIEPGIDFVEVIEQAVGCCEVLIVMMGDQWLTLGDANGNRRLDNPSDFVRLEIAEALQRNIRIIPVLVDGASMPRPEDLPPELARLTRRNAIELSDARWAFDVDRLLQTIEGVLMEKAPSAIMQKLPSKPAPEQENKEQESREQEIGEGRERERKRARAALVLSLLVVLALWIGVGLGKQWVMEPSPSQSNQMAPEKPAQTSVAPEKAEPKTETAAALKKTTTAKKVEKKGTGKPKPAPVTAEPGKAEAGKGRGKAWKEWVLNKLHGRNREDGEPSAPARSPSSAK